MELLSNEVVTETCLYLCPFTRSIGASTPKTSGPGLGFAELALALGQWFSKRGPRTSSISVTWGLVGNTHSQAPHQTDRIRNYGVGSAGCFHKPCRWLWCTLKFNNHDCYQNRNLTYKHILTVISFLYLWLCYTYNLTISNLRGMYPWIHLHSHFSEKPFLIISVFRCINSASHSLKYILLYVLSMQSIYCYLLWEIRI